MSKKKNVKHGRRIRTKKQMKKARKEKARKKAVKRRWKAYRKEVRSSNAKELTAQVIVAAMLAGIFVLWVKLLKGA